MAAQEKNGDEAKEVADAQGRHACGKEEEEAGKEVKEAAEEVRAGSTTILTKMFRHRGRCSVIRLGDLFLSGLLFKASGNICWPKILGSF